MLYLLRQSDKDVDDLNLVKLFPMQKVLDDRINKEKGLEGQDLLDKKILALQVELGELANEWRGFKFWSEDQEPRTFEPNPDDPCEKCNGDPTIKEGNKIISFCDNCDGVGVHFHNPLLEEYVDCLHFILSIGLEKGWSPSAVDVMAKARSINEQFNGLFYEIAIFSCNQTLSNYHNILKVFKGLGEMLGFTWEQIESAYINKNEINHARQSEGY